MVPWCVCCVAVVCAYDVLWWTGDIVSIKIDLLKQNKVFWYVNGKLCARPIDLVEAQYYFSMASYAGKTKVTVHFEKSYDELMKQKLEKYEKRIRSHKPTGVFVWDNYAWQRILCSKKQQTIEIIGISGISCVNYKLSSGNIYKISLKIDQRGQEDGMWVWQWQCVFKAVFTDEIGLGPFVIEQGKTTSSEWEEINDCVRYCGNGDIFIGKKEIGSFKAWNTGS